MRRVKEGAVSAIEKSEESSPPVAGNTLSEVLQKTAHAQLPSQFYGLLQLSLPLAYQAWTWQFYRTAGWLFVVSAFGLWALGQQHLKGHADCLENPETAPSQFKNLWQALRDSSAIIGSV